MSTSAELARAFGLVKPRFTYILFGVNIAIFIVQMALEFLLGDDLLFYFGGKINEFVILGEWWRLITPIFLHADVLHIAFNSYALFVFGREVETYFGYPRFLVLYFFSGMLSSAFSFIFEPHPSLGASGAIMGVLAASGIMFYENGEIFGAYGRSRAINVAILVVINTVLLIGGNTDVWGHFGGAVGGVITCVLMGPLWHVEFNQLTLHREVHDERALKGWRWLVAGAMLLAPFIITYGYIYWQ